MKAQVKFWLKQFPFIYPKSIIASCKNWIDKENAKDGIYTGIRKHTYSLVEEPENHTHKLPVLADKGDADKFSANVFYQTAPSYLYYLKDCYVYKQRGLVLTNRNALFQEFTHNFNIEPLKRFILKNPFYTFSSQTKNIKGVGAMLVSPQSHNYYHWLFDVLPRIRLYADVLDHISHFCISAAVPQKFLDMLPQFGIPLNKILLVNDIDKLHFDNLYVASLPGSEGRAPKWGIDYVRKKLLPNTSPEPTRKIYLKRGDQGERKILNESAIISLLEKAGFEIIDPETLSIEAQIELMQKVKLVISAHGAALSNLLFVQEGIEVIELFSSDYFRTDCYFTLARMLNLRYQYLLGTKPANANWGDIEVSEEVLFKLLHK
ncbi:MAG: glycosyltransferase family 61 protein [Mucilaginibacter sp.]|nr:glycosyltransferase family 61 protein [Mucilaginibacter sp.]